MRQHPGNVGANYHYLLLKESRSQLEIYIQQFKDMIRQFIDGNNAMDLWEDPIEEQKKVFTFIFENLKQTQQGRQALTIMKEKLLNRAKQLYQFGSQRNYFLIQNFRETTQQPIASSSSSACFNLLPLYKICVNKELRRVIWQRSLINETTKQQFFKHDHKVSPYNIIDQLKIGINRLALENSIKLKQNQKDIILRILQYVVKKWDRIPNRSEQYLALNVVELFSHYTPTKMHEIGSIYVGIIELTEYYFEPDLKGRLENIHLAFQLVDLDTYELLKHHYMHENQRKLEAALNQIFQNFRLTLSAAYLPIIGSQFLIDQLLIKKKNKFDIYILFAIMFMIMSDDLEQFKESKAEISEIIYPQKTKKTIKIEDVTDAFKVIYENIPVYHVGTDLPDKNRLFQQLLRFDQIQQQQNQAQKRQANNQVDDEALQNFVKEDKRGVMRLGNLIQQ